ncbi:MAG: transcriptional activator RfaH [Alphaproteobacteria bacterium]|jgi:transcriptional antiterminator RfaH|nr:transcriptional activator RfaH [Alphaproteobacteria bacterium]
MDHWYVVHTRPNGEQTALANLLRQDFRTYLPQYLRRRRHARKLTHVRRPLFPRYLFVRLDLERERWRAIYSTVGVSHMVGTNEMPMPLPEGVVEEISTRENAEGLVDLEREKKFRPGDRLQILSGALINKIGQFATMDDSDRVVLLLDLLGRQVRVKIPGELVSTYD